MSERQVRNLQIVVSLDPENAMAQATTLASNLQKVFSNVNIPILNDLKAQLTQLNSLWGALSGDLFKKMEASGAGMQQSIAAANGEMEAMKRNVKEIEQSLASIGRKGGSGGGTRASGGSTAAGFTGQQRLSYYDDLNAYTKGLKGKGIITGGELNELKDIAESGRLKEFAAQLKMSNNAAKELVLTLGTARAKGMSDILGLKDMTTDLSNITRIGRKAGETLEHLAVIPGMKGRLGFGDKDIKMLEYLRQFDVKYQSIMGQASKIAGIPAGDLQKYNMTISQMKEMIAEMKKIERMTFKDKTVAAPELLGLSPSSIEGFQKAGMNIKSLSKAFDNLDKTIQHPATKLKDVNRLIRDMNAGVTVKGAGRVEGLFVNERDIELMREAARISPEFSSKLKEMGIQIDVARGALGKLFASARNYMKFQAGWFLGATMIFTVVAAMKELAKASMEFQQTLFNIQAVTGESVEKINLISDAAKRVASETPMAATEAAKMGLQLIRAGLSAEDAAAGLEVASKVAIVSGEDSKVVADTFATAIMAWKINADKAEQVGNVLAAGLNYSRLTIQDLGVAFNYAAGVMSSFGHSLSETVSIFAVYSNMGVKASTIATGFTQLMSEFLAPSAKAAVYLKTIGLNTAELNPLTNTYVEILEKLEKAGFNAAKSMEIFQTRAGRSLIIALRAGSEEFRKMQENIEKSRQLIDGLNTVMKGPIAAFQGLWNEVKNAALQLGYVLGPAVVNLTQVLKLLATALVHTINVLTSLPAILIALAYGLWKVVSSVKALEKASLFLSGWGKIIAIFAGVLLGGTIIDKIFGKGDDIKKIDTLNKGIFEAEKNINKSRGAFTGLAEDMDNVTSAANNFKKMFDEINTEWMISTDGIIKNVEGVWRSLDDLFKKAGETRGAFKNMMEMINEQGSKKENTWIDNLIGKFKELKDSIHDASEQFKLGMKHEYNKMARPINKVGEYLFGTTADEKNAINENIQKIISENQDAVTAEAYANIDLSNALGKVKLSWGDIEGAAKKYNEYTTDEKIIYQIKEATSLYQQQAKLLRSTYENVLKDPKKAGDKKALLQATQVYDNEMDALVRQTISKTASIRAQGQKEEVKDLIESLRLKYDAVKKHASSAIENTTQLNEIEKTQDERRFNEAIHLIDMEKAAYKRAYDEKVMRASDYYEKVRLLEHDRHMEEITGMVREANKLEELNRVKVKGFNERYAAADAARDAVFDRYAKGNLSEKSFDDLKNEMTKLTTELSTIQEESDKIVIANKNIKETLKTKVAGAVLGYEKMTEEQEYEGKRAVVNEWLKDVTDAIGLKTRLNDINKQGTDLMKEYFEIEGRWADAQDTKIKSLREEKDAVMNGLDAKLMDIKARLWALGLTEYESSKKTDDINKLWDEIAALERLKEITGKVFDARIAQEPTDNLGWITKGIDDVIKEYGDLGKRLYDATRGVASSMKSAFSDFFDVTSDNFMKFGKLAISVLTGIQKKMADMLSDELTKYIMKGISGLLVTDTSYTASISPAAGSNAHQGGLIMHSGGLIPKFHSGGLSSDERQAVLQTGEYVVSRRGVQALDRINSGNTGNNISVLVNVENKSSQEVDAKAGEVRFDGKQYITNIILEDAYKNGPISQTLRRR